MGNEISVLKFSQSLRDGYFNIPLDDRASMYLNIQLNNPKSTFDMDYDVVFVGSGRFMIYATDDTRYYIRPCLDNPQYSCCRSGVCIEDACRCGSYVDSFDIAMKTAMDWMHLKPDQLPAHDSLPKMVYSCC